MSWFGKKEADPELITKVAREAETLYRSGTMHCAEAVLAAIRNNFAQAVPESVVFMASGFGGGSQTGCICGAVSGGTAGIGLVLGDDRKKTMKLTKSLHEWFISQYGVTCCRVVRGENKGVCPELTGRVAGKIAELLQSQ